MMRMFLYNHLARLVMEVVPLAAARAHMNPTPAVALAAPHLPKRDNTPQH
jgi:ABC-type enterobactin transport system permease subunit